ncbi:hypothetical protein PPERSA_00191 [Pseudocohnilembus persalinus]|uniref:Uncharacterized protein n=1 Tax=Pseudocohnilembus persalinus TaxID=266149 RepID=A0A0V0QQA9_PSEPJ|nr:hypothetical protein PPERSA_00191 [Pseudocohnilembus persalinus]|eukprot:KRX04422.1 hypothetical protein PPERSA_00191 [Pseudocohnilembus persalinus]
MQIEEQRQQNEKKKQLSNNIQIDIPLKVEKINPFSLPKPVLYEQLEQGDAIGAYTQYQLESGDWEVLEKLEIAYLQQSQIIKSCHLEGKQNYQKLIEQVELKIKRRNSQIEQIKQSKNIQNFNLYQSPLDKSIQSKNKIQQNVSNFDTIQRKISQEKKKNQLQIKELKDTFKNPQNQVKTQINKIFQTNIQPNKNQKLQKNNKQQKSQYNQNNDLYHHVNLYFDPNYNNKTENDIISQKILDFEKQTKKQLEEETQMLDQNLQPYFKDLIRQHIKLNYWRKSSNQKKKTQINNMTKSNSSSHLDNIKKNEFQQSFQQDTELFQKTEKNNKLIKWIKQQSFMDKNLINQFKQTLISAPKNNYKNEFEEHTQSQQQQTPQQSSKKFFNDKLSSLSQSLGLSQKFINNRNSEKRFSILNSSNIIEKLENYPLSPRNQYDQIMVTSKQTQSIIINPNLKPKLKKNFNPNPKLKPNLNLNANPKSYLNPNLNPNLNLSFIYNHKTTHNNTVDILIKQIKPKKT